MIERCIQRDRKAQYELYRLYVDSLYHTVIRITGNQSDAQDVVQEGFVKIFKQLGRFRGESGLYAWMKRIMINEAISFLRKKKHTPDPVGDLSEEGILPVVDLGENVSIGLVKQIHVAIRQLPKRARQVISMFLFEGMTHKEIAQVLAISESTSKTQYMRAKQLVRNYLNAENVS